MEGTLNTQGVDVSITSTTAHLKGIRVDIEVMGTSNYQVANTTEGWVYMPVMGMSTAQKWMTISLKQPKTRWTCRIF